MANRQALWVCVALSLVAQAAWSGVSPALPRFDRFNSQAHRYFVYNGEKYKIANKPQIFVIGDKKFEYFHQSESVQPGEAPRQAKKVSTEEFLAASKLYRVSNFVSYLREFDSRSLKNWELAPRAVDYVRKECSNEGKNQWAQVCLSVASAEDDSAAFFAALDLALTEKAKSREANWDSLSHEKQLEALFSVKQDFEKTLRAGELFFDSQFRRADNAKAGIFDPGIDSQDVYYPGFVLAAEKGLMKAYVAEAITGVPKSQIENDIYLYAVYLKTQGLISKLAAD